MKTLLMILWGMTLACAVFYPALSERNYYQDELVLKNPDFPVKFGLWGEPNTPERGWFVIIENSTGKAQLKTKWGTVLADGITTIGYDNNRLALIVGPESRYLEPRVCEKYKEKDAEAYARGMLGVMAYTFEGRPFVKNESATCIYATTPLVYATTRNAINSYHYLFPCIHVAEYERNNATWCFEKP